MFGWFFGTQKGVETNGFQNRKLWGLSKLTILVHQQFWYTFVCFQEQETARNEGVFSSARHALALHVFNVGPKWVFPFAKTVHEKNAILAMRFPGICCISESAEKLQTFFGSALSHLIIRRRLEFGLLRRAKNAENGLPVVHMCWYTLGALPRFSFGNVLR